MTTMDIKYQLVTPGNHRAINKQRYIKTSKNHFIAGLCSVDANFNLQIWYSMIQKPTISLNLLQQSKLHPQLPAYTHLHREFDYNSTPLVPPGKNCGGP